VDCFERFKQHSTPKKNSTGIKGALMKYGVDAFSFVILEECGREELNEREVFWISELGTLSPGGYNLNSGGGAPTFVSDETKAKTSSAMKGKASPKKGKTLSPEHREKISSSSIGKTKSPETLAKRTESRRRAKAARTEAEAFAAPLQKLTESLRQDKQYVAIADKPKPLSAHPGPTIEELDALLKEWEGDIKPVPKC
jgi:group I intron endonuclease